MDDNIFLLKRGRNHVLKKLNVSRGSTFPSLLTCIVYLADIVSQVPVRYTYGIYVRMFVIHITPKYSHMHNRQELVR